MLGKVTNRMPSGEKAMNRKGPMDSGVNKDIRNPVGRVSGKPVSFPVWGDGAGVKVGPSVAVEDGTGVDVPAAVGVGGGCVAPVAVGCGSGVVKATRVGETTCWEAGVVEGSRVKSGIGVPSAAAAGDWAVSVGGTNSELPLDNRVAAGSEEPQASKNKTIGTNADNANPIRNTIHPQCLTILC